MKTKCLISKRYIVAASLMLISVVLTCYSAIANPQRRGTLNTTSTVGGEPGERDRDPDYIEKRGEFFNRFFGTGPGGVSPAAYRGWASDGTGVTSKSALAKRELQVARSAGGIAAVDLANSASH